MAAGSNAPQLDTEELRREVSVILRAAEDPNALTFKQVRMAVEKSLGLSEGTLQKDSKLKIKTAVHSVMDELEAEEGNTQQSVVAAAGSKATREDVDDEDEDERRKASKSAGQVKSKQRPSKRRKLEAEEEATGGKHGDGRSKARQGSRNQGSKGGDGGGGGDSRDDLDDDVVCVLSEARTTRKQVSVKKWKGNVQVDVREYFADKEGEFKPGRKGITLNASQWKAITDAREAIDSLLSKLK